MSSRLAQDLGSGRASTRWAVTALRPQTIMNNVCSNILSKEERNKARMSALLGISPYTEAAVGRTDLLNAAGPTKTTTHPKKLLPPRS